MSHLINFYGEECPHCIAMFPMIEKVEKDLGVVIDKVETWHHPENDKLLQKYDEGGACGGVPFFINTKSRQTLCGEVSYEEVKAWAMS